MEHDRGDWIAVHRQVAKVEDAGSGGDVAKLNDTVGHIRIVVDELDRPIAV